MVECEYEINTAIAIHGYGFNRYMVECELSVMQASLGIAGVLIDTWWNVNAYTSWNGYHN